MIRRVRIGREQREEMKKEKVKAKEVGEEVESIILMFT